MITLRKKDVPAGAAITIVALVLLAGAVKGREAPEPGAAVVEPSAVQRRDTGPEPQPASADDIDLEKLKRPRREGAMQDLFPARPAAPPAPVAIAIAPPPRPAPPPPPSAPPLPFKYLGRLADSEKLIVFLERNQETLTASTGESIDGLYEVEKVTETTVEFLFKPLGTRQILAIPAQP